MSKCKLVLIAHNLRSAHNVGSLLRTADGLGIERIYLSGYTPYPASADDERLPHLRAKITRRINKTSLGAEKSTSWSYEPDIFVLLTKLKSEKYTVAALEQTPSAVALHSYKVPDRIAIIVGREVEGIEKKVLDFSDVHIQIPMKGKKESLNVSIAAAISLYLVKLKGDGLL